MEITEGQRNTIIAGVGVAGVIIGGVFAATRGGETPPTKEAAGTTIETHDVHAGTNPGGIAVETTVLPPDTSTAATEASTPQVETPKSSAPHANASTPTTAKPTPPPPSSNNQPQPVLFVFDGLGGGSSVIKTYHNPNQRFVTDPNTHQTVEDISETYFSGDQVAVECQTTGRDVESVTNLGERYKNSNVWIKLARPVVSYATYVYGNTTVPVPQIPPCP